jgi:hypothetical protein
MTGSRPVAPDRDGTEYLLLERRDVALIALTTVIAVGQFAYLVWHFSG